MLQNIALIVYILLLIISASYMSYCSYMSYLTYKNEANKLLLRNIDIIVDLIIGAITITLWICVIITIVVVKGIL